MKYLLDIEVMSGQLDSDKFKAWGRSGDNPHIGSIYNHGIG